MSFGHEGHKDFPLCQLGAELLRGAGFPAFGVQTVGAGRSLN